MSPTHQAPNAALSRNPYTGEELARYDFQSSSAVDDCLTTADMGFRRWSSFDTDRRCGVLRQVASMLRAQVDELALMASHEMGKPIGQARAEVEKCAVLCDWCIEHGARLLADQSTLIGPEAYVSYLPTGLVLGVMPWNFPYWQVMRNALPILLGGNGYVLKHAPNVMGCAYLMQDVFGRSGLPKGTFSVLNTDNDLVGRVIADRRIVGVAVTGSVRAGSAIGAQAGAALKKSVLELGGADPFIVLADADLEKATTAAVFGRFQNTGQVCIAAKRIILEAPIAKEFTERFVEKVAALKTGDPLDAATYVGPMARYDLRDELADQVDRTVAGGAQVLLGGAKLDGAGNFFEPTILAGVTPAMASFREELFGPVASLIEARDVEDAVALANNSEFGLSGALWTADTELAKRIARKTQTGGMFINSFAVSDPRVPIGGVKKSGYGRELSHFGVLEFVNAQTVWVDRV